MSEKCYKNEEITKEILDSIKVGYIVRCNGWKRGLRVKAVSKNYILMSNNAFGKCVYSVCEKVKFKGIGYNNLKGGFFSIGIDNMIFGDNLGYKFNEENIADLYLEKFEKGELELSLRNSCALFEIIIKEK